MLREAPASDTLPAGCRFHPRCPLGHRSLCQTADPPLQAVGDGHTVASLPAVGGSLVAEAARRS